MSSSSRMCDATPLGQAVGITGLTISEPGKLFGVAKNKLALEARFVGAIDGLGIQRQVGGKEQGVAGVFGIPLIQQDHHPQRPFERAMIEHLGVEVDPVFATDPVEVLEILPVDLTGVGFLSPLPPGAFGDGRFAGVRIPFCALQSVKLGNVM